MARYLNLLVLMCLAALANGAAIDRTTDSYQNLPVEDLDINENLIPHDESGDIEGLLPPKPDATDFYTGRRESSYVIDKVKNTLTLKGDSKKEEEKPTTVEDTEAMKDWTELLEKLLQNENVRATGIVSEDGVPVEVEGVDEKSDEINIREPIEQISITTEPAVETTTDAETFTTDDGELYPADEARPDEEISLVSFLSSVWDAFKSSIKVAGNMFHFLTNPPENTEVTSTEPASTSSAATLVALEEPIKQTQLPSAEFEKRGRDIDSLLYGHGIV